MSPTADDLPGTFDNHTCLILPGNYAVEADGPRATRLTVRHIHCTPPLVYSRTYPVTVDKFLARYPSLARGVFFHAEIRHGKIAELLTYDDVTPEPEHVGVAPVHEAIPATDTTAAEVDGIELLESFTSGRDAVVHDAEGAYAGFVEAGRVGLAGNVGGAGCE